MTQQSLSDFWRIKKSHDEAVELRNVQDGLTSLANILGGIRGRKFRASWGSINREAVRDAEEVTLDAFPISDNKDFPISGDRTDVVAGLMLRKIAQKLFQYPEDRGYYRNLGPRYGTVDWDSYSKVSDPINKTVNDIYVESEILGVSPACHAYVTAARQYYRSLARQLAQASIQACQSEDTTTIKDILNLWSLCTTYDEPVPSDLSLPAIEALTKLLVLSRHIVRKDKKLSWILNQVWDAVKGFPTEVQKPELPQDSGGEGEESGEEGEKSQGGQGESKEQDEPSREDAKDKGSQSGEQPEPEDEREGETGTGEEQGTGDEEGEEDEGEDEDFDESEEDEGESGKDSEEAGDSGESKEEALANVASGLMSDALDSLSQDLGKDQLQALEEAIDYEREDISQDVKRAGDPDKSYAWSPVGARGGESIIMELGEYDEALEQHLFVQTQDQATRISNAFEQWERSRTHYVRGAEEGHRLDGRLLYRGAMRDRHVFKAKEIMHDLDMAVCLLVDSSGSVSSDDWDVFQHVTATVAQALGYRDDVDLVVMAYTSERGSVLDRVWDTNRRELRIVRRHAGGTPSGQCIAACRDVIFHRFSRHKDKLLIHVTDGVPGSVGLVTQEVEACHKAGVSVMSLIIDQSNQLRRLGDWSTRYRSHMDESLKPMYGKDYRIIADWTDLPEQLEALLRGALEKRV